MARQAEMLNENRLRVPRPAVRKRHGPWRAIRGAGDVGVQEGTDPFGGSIRGIAKAMARAPEADAVPGQSALDLGSPQLTSSDRFGRSSSEPLTKRLLKVALERREQLGSSCGFERFGLQAHQESEADEHQRPAAHAEHSRAAT